MPIELFPQRSLGRSLVALLSLFAILGAPVRAGGKDTLSIPAKELPLPTTVSPELAEVIAQPLAEFPTARTTEAWKKLEETYDAKRGTETRALAEALGVTIEDTTVGGVPCFVVTPKQIADANKDRLLVHLHGGAYVLGGGIAGPMEAVLVANACKTRILSVDYRMPPDHPFPAALDDAVAVWKTLLEDHQPSRLALFGTSAGGGLTMATVHKLKELSLPLPAALMVGTPASDITKTGDTYFTNAEVDNGLGRYEGFIEQSLKLYAGSTDPKNPLVSPVYGDFTNFPPTILLSGTRDLLLSNTVRVHRKMRAASVPAELHVYEGQSHADYLRAFKSPESEDALGEVAAFFDRHLAPAAPQP